VITRRKVKGLDSVAITKTALLPKMF
jgi:hypothetical protein